MQINISLQLTLQEYDWLCYVMQHYDTDNPDVIIPLFIYKEYLHVKSIADKSERELSINSQCERV
ncbi:MAG: hypothetical protein JW802_06530 [Campylobacterales bacterium]|uniref:Uncharacterized protein n=1 Tax=Sulfurospirillum barnesii (strain ATCC 700032 / DSM 10660 / SES-3) TaxID=760154 RepID=I3XWF1_SULBS|nr:hypothetical protein [Sulfurospirillum barnesii]AFL68275.1 hypothetical protein Sulba_0974 [Sulfurospirillum barnesii SES-3]MBN1839682.1 hypothetical protein [Campylobacterales bacterium]MBN2832419.1 hypothetical protein [Campylobacterales bacterium]